MRMRTNFLDEPRRLWGIAVIAFQYLIFVVPASYLDTDAVIK
jgi:hypothetical protein